MEVPLAWSYFRSDAQCTVIRTEDVVESCDALTQWRFGQARSLSLKVHCEDRWTMMVIIMMAALRTGRSGRILRRRVSVGLQLPEEDGGWRVHWGILRTRWSRSAKTILSILTRREEISLQPEEFLHSHSLQGPQASAAPGSRH